MHRRAGSARPCQWQKFHGGGGGEAGRGRTCMQQVGLAVRARGSPPPPLHPPPPHACSCKPPQRASPLPCLVREEGGGGGAVLNIHDAPAALQAAPVRAAVAGRPTCGDPVWRQASLVCVHLSAAGAACCLPAARQHLAAQRQHQQQHNCMPQRQRSSAATAAAATAAQRRQQPTVVDVSHRKAAQQGRGGVAVKPWRGSVSAAGCRLRVGQQKDMGPFACLPPKLGKGPPGRQ